jgi:hypothetical protein
MVDQNWQVNVAFTEDGGQTRADAILELAGQRFHGWGRAKRAPEDPSVPVIGQDLAAARALSAPGCGRGADREVRGPHRQGARLTGAG